VKLQLELGGKDPTYVRADADPKAAAESLADGAMYNTGQSCCSVERIYVHESPCTTRSSSTFVATVDGFKVGDPPTTRPTSAPSRAPPQLDLLDAQVADAQGQGRHAAPRRPPPGPATPRAHRVHRGEPHDGADARGKLRPGRSASRRCAATTRPWP
jgi:acyl-CoA reductase-like NAD-dependent aldehyde dehydrogenase